MAVTERITLIERDPSRLTATDALNAIAAGTLTAEALVTSCLDRIARVEQTVRAWVALDPDSALEQARAVDQRLAEGEPLRKLSGIPVGVKDVFNTLSLPTQMGSPIWEGFKAGNDARAVAVLRQEGAVVPGKTVTSEFAVHWPGPTRNPHNVDHTPGTSSSGSVAAVATGMVPVALCTQTGGSTIRPSSYCGVYGMKPSFGLIPRTGMLKTTDTLDHVGFCARSLDDLALLLDVLRVSGPDYPIVAKKLRNESQRKASWRVAMVKGPHWASTEAYARAALEEFARAIEGEGILVEEGDLPKGFGRASGIHADLYDSCLAYYFKAECERKPELLSPRFLAMVERGRQVTPARYEQALREQAGLSRALDGFFDRYDVILTLASNGGAPKGEEPEQHLDTCLIWTLCGVPAVSIPVLRSLGDLPFGAQLVARKYGDLTLLSFAKELERRGHIGPIPAVSPE